MEKLYDKKRNSSIETLRLILIIGIVVMHMNGTMMASDDSSVNIWLYIVNGFCNISVSVFVLISGYYGVNGDLKKILMYESKLLEYSLLSSLILCVFFDYSIKTLILAFIPFSTNRYWFMTCYMLLLIFSPFLNKIIEIVSYKQFRSFLLLMITVFSFVPTIIYFHPMGDSGKNIINFIMLYFIGAYIKKYDIEIKFKKKTLCLVFLTSFLAIILLNFVVTILSGSNKIHIPFSRDCSILVLMESVSIFLYFLQYQFYNKTINNFANHVFAIYLFEETFRLIIQQYIVDYLSWYDKWYYFVINISFAVFVVVMIVFIDILVQKTVEPIFIRGLTLIVNQLNNNYNKWQKNRRGKTLNDC